MAGEISGREVTKNMEYLLKLLHKEWERSGRTRAEVSFHRDDAKAVHTVLGQEILQRQKALETEDMSFKESLELSKENFVLLRLVRKLKKAEEKAVKKAADKVFAVELDKDEYKLFSLLIKTEEA